MRSVWIFRGVIAVAALLAVILATIAALPFVASTQIVKDHLAMELSRWSGYRVSLVGDPDIRLWPNMRAILEDVRLAEWGATGNPAVIASELLEIDLSLTAALRGRVEPSRVRFVRPTLRLRRKETDYFLPPAAGGRFSRAVTLAGELLKADPSNPDLSRLPDDEIGAIEFVDGRIVAREAGADADTVILSSLTGTLQWPAMNRELGFRASAIWRGENVSVTGTTSAPLFILAGGSAPFRLALESAPLNSTFNGTIDLRGPTMLNGELAFQTPSLERALTMAGIAPESKLPVGAVALSGTLESRGLQAEISEANVTIGGDRGSGTLEFAIGGAVPAISGTLAFETLNLAALLAILAPGQLPPESGAPARLADTLHLDLRLSAASVAAGPAQLNNVAAAIQLKDELMTFDISDSTAFGGSIVTGIRIDRKAGTDGAEFRLLADRIDASAFSAAIGAGTVLPKAEGKVSVILKGPFAEPTRFLEQASGSINAVFGAGTIGTVTLDQFVERARKGGFFSLEEVAGGSLAFDRAELKATLQDGVARIERAAATVGEESIVLSGVAEYSERSMALTGLVAPTPPQPGTSPAAPRDDRRISFFAGGSWDSPYISAVLPLPPALDAEAD